jgi:uncharacterized Zn-binding protein involved in type VI secretion
MKLVAVVGDMSSHGNGSITAVGGVPSVTVNGLPIAINTGLGSGADSDADCDPDSPDAHCSYSSDPAGMSGPVAGSLNVLVRGVPVHGVGDLRGCGATTILGPTIRTVTMN